MGMKADISDLAVAAWRLERWLDNLEAERKMAAKSALRSIKKYLEAFDIEIVDPVGAAFDPGLAIEVVNNEAEDADESDLIIAATSSPIIKQDGAVIQRGRVILGTSVNKPKPNAEIKADADAGGELRADVNQVRLPPSKPRKSEHRPFVKRKRRAKRKKHRK